MPYLLNKFKQKILFYNLDILYKLGNFPAPKYVVWDISRNCNLNCLHCGAKKKKYSKELTTPEIKNIVDQLSENQVEYFTVTGGEPLLRTDVLDILDYARKLGLKTGLATNGYYLDKKVAKEINDKGIGTVQVSIDGDEETHNQIRRNTDAYRRAVDAVKNLKKYPNIQVTISTVISPININKLEKIKDLAKSLGVEIWKITTIMPIGNAEKKNLYLNKRQFEELMSFIEKNSKNIHIEVGENMGFLGKWDKKVRQSPFYCPVGLLACCIGVDGIVRGCPEQPDTKEFQEGSALDKPLIEIWNNGFRMYRERAALKTDEKCRKCKEATRCYGGCWVMRKNKTNCTQEIYELS